MTVLSAIPTNIITGFLGVGKTTAILHLLKSKPANERWAVLVNEFGEVGIDGSLFQGAQKEEQGFFIREVPGGCMCCAAGLPMQLALNMLLARAKPHRLLIEPTGLGHPKEVLGVLSSEYYRNLLDLRATVTMIDARKLQDDRYTSADTFNQQLEIADIIVANKSDQYQQNDFPDLLDYLEKKPWFDNQPVYQVSMGQLQREWLNPKTADERQPHHHHHAAVENSSLANSALANPAASTTDTFTGNPELPECGYLGITNKGEGFHSQGWIFKSAFIFNRDKLYHALIELDAERVKGVFITDQGVVGYNKADNVLTEYELDEVMDSRIECISMASEPLNNLEQKILDCLVA